MELADGRLPNGDDVLTLFSSTDNLFLTLLDLGVDDPLAIDFNDPLDMLLEIEGAALDAQDQLVGASSRAEREKVEQAVTALGKLKELYQEIVAQQIAQEQAVEEGGEGEQPPQAEGGEQPPDEEKELSTLELELKAFNYGAKVGEVISGQLARGAGGRFVSAAQLSAARSKLLADLLARLRAKRGTDTLDAMARMRNGDPIGASEQEKLIAQGLAEVNADGSVTMTSDGRSLLSAANSGDVDRAKKALAKAGEPDKPPKGPRGKKTPEQLETERQLREEQRERERQEELALNRAESFDRAAEEFGIDRGDLDALQSFGAGGELTSEVANRLADTGLVEIGEDGRPRLTSNGRKFLSAAEKGDIRTRT
jgi:predicted transcriptional regulator